MKNDNEILFESNEKSDTRIVFGATCMWWDNIYGAATTGVSRIVVNGRKIETPGLPCCPHCGGMLMEAPDFNSWMDAAKQVESKDHAGYVDFIAWNRGKCFKSRSDAIATYSQSTGKFVDNVHTIDK